MLRSAARRAREAQENPAAAAAAAAPAPPPARRRRAARRKEPEVAVEAAPEAEEGREEEIEVADLGREGGGEKKMEGPDSGARSADKQAVEDEGNTTPVPDTVRCSLI